MPSSHGPLPWAITCGLVPQRRELSVQRVEDNEEIIERVAAIDVGKSEVVACVRVPDPGRPGRRQQEIIHCSTLTPRLLGLADRLCELGVTRVVMEATSDYWSECAVRNSPKGCGGKRGVC